MPRPSAQVCKEPGCYHLRPCPLHPPIPWAGSTRRQRLPKDWNKRRARVLREEPQCRHCGAPSAEVDHICNEDDHSRANLQALCVPCHRLKTQGESARARWGGVPPRCPSSQGP